MSLNNANPSAGATGGGATSSSSSSSEQQKLQSLIHGHTVEMSGKKTNFWTATLETMGMVDGGKTHSTDLMVDSLSVAVTALQAKVAEANDKDTSGTRKWTFPHTPFGDFDATPTDLITAFCKWAREKTDEERSNEKTNPSNATVVTVDWTTSNINVSKAFRRLTNYVGWVEEQVQNGKKNPSINMFAQPIDVTHLDYVTVTTMGMKVTHDKYGRIVWWMDLECMNRRALHDKSIPVVNIARYMVWLAHLMLFDVQAQDCGFVFVENLANVSLFATATLVPMDVSAIINRLTIGVLPLKMKQMLILRADGWMHVLMNLFKPFMAAKLRQRVHMVHKPENAQAVFEAALGGREHILSGSCGLDGTLKEELVFGKYFAAQAAAAKEKSDTTTAANEEATC